MALVINHKAVSRARSLIAAGKVDHGPWDGKSAPRNADTCLAHDTDAPPSEEWKYPVISGDHVSAKGLGSAAGYATADNAHAVASVAHGLSDEIHSKLHATIRASASGPYVLHLSDVGEGKALPLALEGLPATNDAGQPIHYRRMKIAVCRDWTHRGTGEAFTISKERADQWARNTAALTAAGVKPFIPGQHRERFNAADNFGYVERVERDGDDVYAVVALHGDDALKVAAKNGRSVYVVKDALDANGKVYPGETLHHLALVPNPALPGLGGTVKIAASADAPARDVPVFELGAQPPSAGSPGRSTKMKPETAQKVRAQLGIPADVPDDQLAEHTALKALALSADVSNLKTERDAAKAEAEAKGREVLALSADRPKPDALTLSMFQENIAAKREAAISSGVVSEAEARTFDELLALADGTPTPLALSACGAKKRPLAFEFWDRLGKLSGNGIRTSNAVERGIPAEPLALSADDPKVKEAKAAYDQGKAWRNQQLEARGLNA